MALESLPPELLTIILQSHDSLLDLHNLISASPACLPVLNSASKHILPAVIRNAIPAHDLKSLNEHLERQAHATQWLYLSSDEYIDSFVVEYNLSYIKCYMYDCTYMSSPHRIRDRIRRYKLYKRLYYLIQVYSASLKGLGLDLTLFTCIPPQLTALQKAFLRYGRLEKDLVREAISPTETPFTNDRYPEFRLFDRCLSRLTPRKVETLVCMELYASFFMQGSIYH
uniref:WGS project CBMI000000000 data, contig CS3069_c002499 n=1 Tax=Fusarium clavum TaxID=2594811 RepID=A0A090MCT1_9HYPO|nr:unnamed protein product [Fusarium clavum]